MMPKSGTPSPLTSTGLMVGLRAARPGLTVVSEKLGMPMLVAPGVYQMLPNGPASRNTRFMGFSLQPFMVVPGARLRSSLRITPRSSICR